MYDQDLALNKLQGLICHRTQPTYQPYLPTPPLGKDVTQVQFFKRSLKGLNSEFSFS